MPISPVPGSTGSALRHCGRSGSFWAVPLSRGSLGCAKRGVGQRRRLREQPGDECPSNPYIKLSDGRPTETEGTSEMKKYLIASILIVGVRRFGLCGDRPIRQHVFLGSRQSQGRANGLLRQCDDQGQHLLLQQRGRQEPIHEESEWQSDEGRVPSIRVSIRARPGDLLVENLAPGVVLNQRSHKLA